MKKSMKRSKKETPRAPRALDKHEGDPGYWPFAVGIDAEQDKAHGGPLHLDCVEAFRTGGPAGVVVHWLPVTDNPARGSGVSGYQECACCATALYLPAWWASPCARCNYEWTSAIQVLCPSCGDHR